jgi:hypothetical protein
MATCGDDLDLQVIDHQWNGDGINALLPTDIDPTAVVPVLIRSLAAELRQDNTRHADRIRLRMAIGLGLSEWRATGYGGPMIMEISRLIDSLALRSALNEAPDADLAVAVSRHLYALVIKAGYPGIPEGQFTQVTASAKEFSETAWIWLSTRQWSTPAYQPLQPDDPREVGGYRLVARIGASQAGQVYLASTDGPAAGQGTTDGSREWVAVKVFDPALSANPDVERRLSVGILGGKVLPGGPNLTRVLAPRELERPLRADSPAWAASTLVRGPSLAAAVNETGPLPADATGWLAVNLARAVATAHLVPLAHQSVCPHNVLLDATGPVLTDWGLNRTALVNGPGAIAADAAADVLMLAATVYYAATGRPPWGEQVDGLADLRDRPDEVDLPGCPATLRPLFAECLAADPAARPSAAAVLSRLTAVVGRQPQSWLPGPVSARVAEYQTLPPFPRGRLRWPR